MVIELTGVFATALRTNLGLVLCCAEFGTEFRYKKGSNHGLGKVFIYVSRAGPVPTGMSYPSDKAKFSDEGGNASDGNAVYFIRNDDGTDEQFE